ncbi:MAG: HEAT repeat domain-containing protein [Bryobacteraceae bacterium]
MSSKFGRFLCYGFLFLAALPLTAATVFRQSSALPGGTIQLPALKRGLPYSFAFSFHSPDVFRADGSLRVRLAQGKVTLLQKTLHAGDADLFSTFATSADTGIEVFLEPAGGIAPAAKYSVQVDSWPAGAAVEREPNNTWQDANLIEPGGTIFGSADDVPYIPLSTAKPASLQTGLDWYRFEFSGPPKLIFFELDLMERDNIPVDVAIFRIKDGGPVAYLEGEDPVTPPHEVQALPGNKFTTRILKEAGTYYIRVAANHPEYKLRTRLYDPPSYTDPRKAVRTAVDYIIAAGDSWHANTPRRGGVYDRIANVHQETSLCVACHATHFPLRAQVYAIRNGYPVQFRQQLQFLAERFYNNPRPFYGFEEQGAVWARVISAPANVLGRMGYLNSIFEREVTGERREEFHRGIREYLKLYYNGRTELPPDETNGNTPLVSAYEVAWYAWEETKDPAIARLIEQDHVKNMADLCYQTLALASIDPSRYAAQIKRNAERILSLQRASGQWAMKFETGEPDAEFQTGHALWALQAAAIPASHPQVKKAIDYLLKRQQPFGGWMDPLQSYENFRTPFRETQMAILALSSYFPGDGRGARWNAHGQGESLLERLDNTWSRPGAEVVKAAASPDALIRQQAVEALGRGGDPSILPVIIGRLGDPSKLVQRTAAWAVRQVYSRHPGIPAAPLTGALSSTDDRTRWGATRVFATHFSGLARRPEFAAALGGLVTDAVTSVRMQAIKGLWQFWFWSPDATVKGQIEDRLLKALVEPQHPWVSRNLHEAVYNIADENIRYLYNNWVPLLSRQEDRDRVIDGRLRIEERLASKFADLLTRGPDEARKTLLAALTQLQMRRSDVYDPSAKFDVPAPPFYNRIGNDIEQIVFFGRSNANFSKALRPLVESRDADLKRLAIDASLLSRDVKFPTVVQAAGDPGPERDKLIEAVLQNKPVPIEVLKGLGKAPAETKNDAAKAAGTGIRPDEEYFNEHVRPIMENRGKDGYACVQCHSTHTLFNGTYATALNVIDMANPENSLILRKPTSNAESEGTVDSNVLSHGGGVRWEPGSQEYKTLLNWIRGAKP